MPDDVSGAPRERAQLAGKRGCLAASQIEAPRRATARVGAPRKRAQARIGADAPVIDRRASHVQDACPFGGDAARRAHPHPVLPLLLVAAVLERDIERPDALQRAAADGHVGAPGVAGVGVLRTELERRDRRSLAPARAQLAALQAGMDRSGEHVHLRVLARRVEKRLQPAAARADVVVDEHHELARRSLDAGVACDVEAERPLVGLVASAEAGGQRARGGGRAGVVDYQHLGSGRRSLRRDRGERHAQVGRRGRAWG